MVGAILSMAGLLTAAPGISAVADAQKASDLTAKASVSSSMENNSANAQIPDRATAICLPHVATYDRFLGCAASVGGVTFYEEENGVKVPVGRITVHAEQTDELAVKSTTVTETVYLYDITESGKTAPTGLGLVVTCGAGCRGDKHGPVALIEGKTYIYTLHFVNSIK
jgi:hypothetical protein